MARGSSAPITTRFGLMKSSMADPSRRNSGLEATENSTGEGCSSRMSFRIMAPVPMGTVLLVTTTL